MWLCEPPKRVYLTKPISMSWLDRKRNSAPNDGQLAWCVLQDCPWRKPSEHWRSRDFPQACNCNWNASKAHPSWRPQRIVSQSASQDYATLDQPATAIELTLSAPQETVTVVHPCHPLFARPP